MTPEADEIKRPQNEHARSVSRTDARHVEHFDQVAIRAEEILDFGSAVVGEVGVIDPRIEIRQ